MVSKVGIIPAAGKASRFGGLFKELLPLDNGRLLLTEAVERLRFCDRIVVVTSADKAAAHRAVLPNEVVIHYQTGTELWGAIQTGFMHESGDYYYMTMPDTWMNTDAFADSPVNEFSMGCFKTNEPERFGVLENGFVTDKHAAAHKPATAWGVMAFSHEIADFWKDAQPGNYTSAINMALARGKWGLWEIGHYFDCANLDRYLDLLRYLKGKHE